MDVIVRPFADGNRARRVEIGGLVDPDSPPSLAQVELADRLYVEVDPAAQRRGVRSALYQAVESALRDRNALSLRAVALAGREGCLAFLLARGFIEAGRAWESRLDVAAFDPARFASIADRVAQQGIRVTSLADHPDILQSLYALYLHCERDAPSLDPRTPITFDQFLKQYVDTPWRSPTRSSWPSP